MKYTILGGSGFIGSHLTASLKAAGTVPFVPERDDPAIFERELGHVIYCIGLTADFRRRPFETVEAHVSYLARVLRHADFTSLLYLSSTRVYAGADAGDEAAALVVRPQEAGDLYNLSKLMGESICLASGRQGVRIARLSNVYGPGAERETFLTALIDEAVGTGRVRLGQHPDSEKDYVHVDDVARLLPRIATAGREPIYNVAGGANVSHRAVLERLVSATSCSVEIAPDAPRLSFPHISIERARRDFDFHPRTLGETFTTLIRQAERRLPT